MATAANWQALDDWRIAPGESGGYKSQAQWDHLTTLLRTVGLARNTKPHADVWHTRGKARWSVTLSRVGGGSMTRAYGRTIEEAWRIAVWHGRGTVFQGSEPYAVWREMLRRCVAGISGKTSVSAYHAEPSSRAICVSVARV